MLLKWNRDGGGGDIYSDDSRFLWECEACGAMVEEKARGKHATWHRKVDAFIAARRECPHCRRPVQRSGDFPCESGCEGYFDDDWKPETYEEE